ncbi:extracellular catalytic domain type 1 short-chain-length polyhydroxyalkanoate depolymerase [Streptomyces sp. IBSBF 2435]|uniref:extracellular catalytic domain type 1 short-chain-length polyhydroxyalkanoate depolymerase n=1 Tax=Streptomyces sp. IBSBF 2435 TaxID=2903531 RepID=UPI002FDC5D96
MRPKIFTRRTVALLAALPLAAAAWLATSPSPASATGASTPAAVVDYLHQISGNHVISGVHNKEPLSNPAQYTAQAHSITGKYPGLWGGELGFTATDVANRQTMINQAKTEWANGSLVALTWHMCKPNVSTCDFNGGINGASLSDSDWSQLITNGSSLNSAYKAKLDTAVPYFQQLKDAGIPVLFRPLHEMNEGWAWWGGRSGANGSARLFQITHDYLVSKGLTNIIWVWNVKDTDQNGGSGGVSGFYPGDSYVDVASLDPWVHTWPGSDWYNAMLNVAHGKPVSLAEVGTVPTAAQLASQPQWAWFMIWSEYLTSANSTAGLQATFNSSRVLSQGQFTIPTGTPTTPPTTPPGGSHTGAVTGVGGKCVDVAAASTANGTAVQLYDCNGSTAQSWTVGTDGTIRALGKCLDVTGQGTANGTKLQIWDCNGSGAQQWSTESDGHLKNPQSGRYLDDPGGSTANATRLQIYDRNTNPWQTWHLPTGGGTTPPPGSCTASLGSGQYNTPVSFDGRTYQVLVHVPTRAAGARLPLVLDLHGSQSTGAGQLSYSNLAPTADANGFIVAAPTGVVPSGSGFIWNVPYVTPSGTRDDAGFLRQVIDTLTANACVDPARVFATGYSGGGRMTSALGCMLADKVAAIAPVSGIRAGRPDPSDRSRPDLSTCTPSRAVPVIAFHGQQDTTNPYNGGGDATAWQYSVPVAQQAWAGLDGCTAGPATAQVSTHVSRTVYSGCRDGAEVQLYTISNGGHTWPDSSQDNGNGTVTHEISADGLMWQFFQQHPMPGSS